MLLRNRTNPVLGFGLGSMEVYCRGYEDTLGVKLKKLEETAHRAQVETYGGGGAQPQRLGSILPPGTN